MALESINPATEEQVMSYEPYPVDEVDDIVRCVADAQQEWRRVQLDERCRLLGALAALLRDESDEHARLITREMGKPISESRSEVLKCAKLCDYYQHHAGIHLEERSITSDAQESYVSYLPLGVILGIMPWNFPFWQVLRFAVPTLTAGNSALLKHASNVTGCALAIERLFQRAGYPDNVFRTLLIPGSEVARIIEAPAVRAVSLTGSTAAGAKVAEAAGGAVKKSVLELGGSDPFIVLKDADVEHAAKTAARARYMNAGQSCIAAKRFILQRDIAERFTERFKQEVASLRIGDPADEQTQMGPMARADLRDELDVQVKESIQAGARAVLGCTPVDRRGYYYAPSILDHGAPGMPAFDDELFGPVALLIRADSEDHAVELANMSPYGLGSSVWTRDVERGKRLASELDCGSTFINSMVQSDPRLPFGGVKQSGFGRELSEAGIREFVNIKTVAVNEASS